MIEKTMLLHIRNQYPKVNQKSEYRKISSHVSQYKHKGVYFRDLGYYNKHKKRGIIKHIFTLTS